MAMRMKFCLSVLLVSLLVLCSGLALAKRDPELEQCQHQCRVQRHYDEGEKKRCIQQCEDYYKEKKGREHGEEGREEEEEAERRVGQCQSQCERQKGEERALCRFRCQQKFGRDEGEHSWGEEKNPYVFEEEHFTSIIKTEHGRARVLQKFTKRSELLRGIKNYRVGILEANPQTFVSQGHWDADGVLYVARGRGTISMIIEEKRQSFNVQRGDVLRIRAGTPLYLINRDEKEKLYVVSVMVPVNIPGEFEIFSASGTEDSESFYEAFSWELLEAALKTERRRLEHIFRQKQGAIVKASREQIQAMSHREEGGGVWPFGTESIGPISILKNPVFRNNYGQLFEVGSRDFKQQLRDLDLSVSVANISRGAMSGPYYNSRVTKISVVLDGEGYFEMACPHLSGSRGDTTGESQKTYQKVSSRLKRGTAVVVPAGHPAAFVASRNNNLEVVCFEINEEGNTRHLLAGKNNIVNKMEKQAKELAFGVSEREVDQAFGRQNEEWFFPGPRRGSFEGHAVA
ncbi:hypothetical protein JCGZ_21894 [Jatropha curcas]|uniref:Cupin type-1 domain-containing protein n=1 Tax=Jatropha curcas TaxID=180498 RepID=A0A067JF64_JATCU|nr:vicilin Jug r 6.0101 [Jatropha curcas]KDP21423.1 hypothetical protein JCGZ_21894 [Jatropha curcas]